MDAVARKLSEGKSNGYMQSHGEWYLLSVRVYVGMCVVRVFQGE